MFEVVGWRLVHPVVSVMERDVKWMKVSRGRGRGWYLPSVLPIGREVENDKSRTQHQPLLQMHPPPTKNQSKARTPGPSP